MHPSRIVSWVGEQPEFRRWSEVLRGKRINYLGQKIGRVTVIEKLPQKGASTTSRWLCVCDCGKVHEKMAQTLAKAIKDGVEASCGCLRIEKSKKAKTTHGHTVNGRKSPEYSAWADMIHRCTHPSNRHYHDYGGRGITVCERWLGKDGFQNFLDDMGLRPSPDMSLDRIGHNGNYEPHNCRWADKTTQVLNRRNAHGQSKTPTWKSWADMKKKASYVDVFVDFRSFLSIMGERPENHVLWRHDYNQPHSPENSFWQDRSGNL